MIRTVLIDDEIDSIKILQRLLGRYCPQVIIVGTAGGVETAEVLIREERPDLVFLDIEMTHGNAFDLLGRFQPIFFHVIFVTAFDHHAIRAFRYNAVDYLLKPVNIKDLSSSVERLSGKLVEHNILERLKTALDGAKRTDEPGKRIAIPTIYGLVFVPAGDIVRVEANGSYVIFHIAGKSRITASGTIKDFEDSLPPGLFFRIHHSHIINLNRIRSYQKGKGGYVLMDDGSSIEVATRRREAFLKRLLE